MRSKYTFQSFSSFDKLLIFFIPLTAYTISKVSFNSEALFDLFLRLNIVFLGYHHVISTFTRISFSLKDFNRNKFLVAYLPLLVFPLAFIMVKYIGLWTIATLYLYWQWFHYTRQSYGISRYYSKSKKQPTGSETINNLAIYLLPLAGIFYRSYQNPGVFIELPVKTLPISYSLYLGTLIMACGCIAVQFIIWMRLFFKGNLNLSYVSYVVSHYAVFALGYMAIEDITIGWLCINIWHNAQYIFFVWLSNNRRFNKGYHKDFGFISKVSQTKKVTDYVLLCLAVTMIVYVFLSYTTQFIEKYTDLPIMIITFMTINFHHYVIDGIIWKKEKNDQINAIEYFT